MKGIPMQGIRAIATSALAHLTACLTTFRRAGANRRSALLVATEEVCEECATSAALIVVARDHGMPLPALLALLQEGMDKLLLSPALTRLLFDTAGILYTHPEIGQAAARHMIIAGCLHVLAHKEDSDHA